MNLDITLEESLLGFSRTIKHMDQHEVEIKSDPQEVIQPFSWKILKDEGMPIKDSGGDFGELHVKMIVGFPTELTAKQKELVNKIFPDDGSEKTQSIKTDRDEL